MHTLVAYYEAGYYKNHVVRVQGFVLPNVLLYLTYPRCERQKEYNPTSNPMLTTQMNNRKQNTFTQFGFLFNPAKLDSFLTLRRHTHVRLEVLGRRTSHVILGLKGYIIE